jgi:hypothetical protein
VRANGANSPAGELQASPGGERHEAQPDFVPRQTHASAEPAAPREPSVAAAPAPVFEAPPIAPPAPPAASPPPPREEKPTAWHAEPKPAAVHIEPASAPPPGGDDSKPHVVWSSTPSEWEAGRRSSEE